MKCLILLLLCLVCAHAQRRPSISYITQPEVITDIGGTAVMKCSVQYASEFPVLWIKLDAEGQSGTNSLPISSSQSIIVADSRFSISLEEQSSTYTLQISGVQESDNGTYQCHVIIGTVDKITADVPLLVRIPPTISDNSTRSLIVSEGQSVQLGCWATGYPPPRVSWRRENNNILPTNSSIFRANILKIPAITKHDRGTYYCVAENDVGRGARRNVAVVVEFAPVVYAPRPRVGQALLYDMDLECRVDAYPPPAIIWMKDDDVLTNNQHYSISHFVTSEEKTGTILRVITIEKKQYGSYTCKAANKLGVHNAQLLLFETVIPVCPPACDQPIYGCASQISAVRIISVLAVIFSIIH